MREIWVLSERYGFELYPAQLFKTKEEALNYIYKYLKDEEEWSGNKYELVEDGNNYYYEGNGGEYHDFILESQSI